MPRPVKIARTEAAAQGLARYYTGKVCKRGHRTQRRVLSGSCCACSRISSRKWKRKAKRADREAYRAKQREYTNTHRDKLRALQHGARNLQPTT